MTFKTVSLATYMPSVTENNATQQKPTPSQVTSKTGSLATYMPSAAENIATQPNPVFSGRSYVLGASYWEQLLGGSRNIMQLQCWVHTLGGNLNAVEPSLQVNKSVFGFSFANSSRHFTDIRLSDLFDMSTWHTLWQGSANGLAPMVSRTNFLSEIRLYQKNVILVQIQYLKPGSACTFSWNTTTLMRELEDYQYLRVKRRACINFRRQLSVTDFKNQVFGDIGTENTVVIFKEWRGIGPGRSYICLPSCAKGAKYNGIRQSKQVLKDAEIYANKYLGGFGQYISVSARFEKVDLHYSSQTLQQRRNSVKKAITESMKKIRILNDKNSNSSIYLTYDYGKFGSSTFKHNNYYNASDLLTGFQHDVYEGRISHDEYEQSFMTLSSRNPGYIAMVQMAVSSRGQCLLAIGWGHCIRFVVGLFKTNHSAPFCIDCAPANICRSQHIV